VLQNLERAETRAAAELLVRACESLILGATNKTAGEAPYLVECRIGSDPHWIEFRLLTRSQCDEANGSTTKEP
jgi:hypothetical protein